MKHKKVSIIIVAYNEERDITDCVESLLRQDYKPLEVIVINDGSNDNTDRLLHDMPIRVFTVPHQGTAISRNFGAKKAAGEILVFLDADMTFEYDFITHLVMPINKGISKGTFSKLEYVSNWDKPLARCWNRVNRPPLPDRIRVLQSNEEGEDFRAILKTEFLRVKGFDNVGYTDTWTLAKKLHYKPKNATGAIYYHMNPETYVEVFHSSRWSAQRTYRLGRKGNVWAMIRAFVLFSFFRGVINAFRYKEPRFVLFQIVYEFGLFMGASSFLFTNKKIK